MPLMQEVEQRTSGAFELGPGTPYRSIKRMAEDGLIAEVPESADSGDSRRRSYTTTPSGGSLRRGKLDDSTNASAGPSRRNSSAGWTSEFPAESGSNGLVPAGIQAGSVVVPCIVPSCLWGRTGGCHLASCGIGPSEPWPLGPVPLLVPRRRGHFPLRFGRAYRSAP